MVLKMYGISRVSQSRFFHGHVHLSVSIFHEAVSDFRSSELGNLRSRDSCAFVL